MSVHDPLSVLLPHCPLPSTDVMKIHSEVSLSFGTFYLDNFWKEQLPLSSLGNQSLSLPLLIFQFTMRTSSFYGCYPLIHKLSQ